MTEAPTDYVMVVGPNDHVEVTGTLVEDIHYLRSGVSTRRAHRYDRPFLPFDPVLLNQLNYLGRPILSKDLVPLFPETAQDAWHTFLIAAYGQGASFQSLDGFHTVVEPWPRPERSERHEDFRTPFDPGATNSESINARPYPEPPHRVPSITIYHRGCSEEVLESFSGDGVVLQSMPVMDFTVIRNSTSEYVGWLSEIEEVGVKDPIKEFLRSMETYRGRVSAKVVEDFTVHTWRLGRFWLESGLFAGGSEDAWFSPTDVIQGAFPDPYTTSYVVVKK